MRIDNHHFTLLEGVALQEVFDVALLTLDPQQLTCAARADDVGPHQARVHQRVPAHYAAVTGEHILNGQHRMARAKQVYQLATMDGIGAKLCRRFDVFGLRGIDFFDDLVDFLDILQIAHNWFLLSFLTFIVKMRPGRFARPPFYPRIRRKRR